MLEGFTLLWCHWCVAGLVLLCLELVIPGVFLLWFGAGAVATGLIFAMPPPVSWQFQAVVFVLLSSVSVYLGRAYMRRKNQPEHATLNKRLLHYVGRSAELERAIVNGEGRIRLGDTFWLARGKDAPSGTRVIVTGVDGSHLLVEPAGDDSATV